MTKKEKLYFRLGCLFLTAGLILTFFWPLSFFDMSWTKNAADMAFSGRDGVKIADIANSAEIAEITVIKEAADVQEGTAGDSVNRAFQEGTVENLCINGSLGEVYLVQSEQFYADAERDGENVYLSGNTLYIDGKKGRLTVGIPRDVFFRSVDVDLGAGSLWMERLSAVRVDVSVKAGKCFIGSLTAEESCRFTCGTGVIQTENLAANDLEATVGLGSMDLVLSDLVSADIKTGIGSTVLTIPGSSKDYTYQISTGVGAVTVDGESYDGFVLKQDAGSGQGRTICVNNGMGTTELCFTEKASGGG